MTDVQQLGGAIFQPDAELLEEGWKYRFVASGRRLLEVQDLYEELGFEVRTESISREAFPEGCEECQLILMLNFKAIYTRRVT